MARNGGLDSRDPSRPRSARKADSDSGFTLVELLIVTAIVPLIVGALSAGLWAVLTLQSGVSGRLGDSGDAQVTNSTFVKDVQSASTLTVYSAASTASQCGTGTQLLGLFIGGVSGTEYVSYNDVLQSGGTYSLVRAECDAGESTTPSFSTNVAVDLTAPCTTGTTQCQALPVIYGGTAGTAVITSNFTTGYVSTQGVTGVNLSVYEPKSKYTFVLSATPAAGLSTASGSLGGPSAGSTCGFALPGTGTYSSTLCFVGFPTTPSFIASAESTGNAGCTTGVAVSSAVPGGYTMSFCLSITLGNSSDQVGVYGFPTWGGAFLGNDINGTPFYSGVGCADSDATTTLVGGSPQGTPSCIDPALYAITSGATDTVTASNIIVTAPGGGDATNYEVVTADAETTDPNESIVWKSTLPTSSPLKFSQIPDTSTSAEGDACNQSTAGTNATGQAVTNGLGLTGINTAQVTCTSTWQSSAAFPRTGTVLLELSPSTTSGVTQSVTIATTLHGAGSEAVSFGLLLP